jgi:uncharacterized membrane protein YgaE (UPF0421/DUF939 family)
MNFLGSKKINPSLGYALRATFFAVASATMAYSTASMLSDWVSPTIAAILALSAIKTSLTDTVKETVKQTAGSFFGALLGITLVALIGFNLLSLAMIVVIAMMVGFLIRLGVPGGLAIAATAVLVSGPLFGDFQSIEQRVAGVFVGAFFAFISSWFIVPWNPGASLLRRSLESGYMVTDLMDEIAKRYRKQKPISSKNVASWLTDIEKLEQSLRNLKNSAKQLKTDSRWTPFVKVKEAEEVYQQVSIVKANASAMKTVIYGIENSVEHGVTLSPEASKQVAKLLAVASVGEREQLAVAELQPAANVNEDVAEIIRARRSRMADEVSNMTDTREIMLSGTIIHEVTKIKDIISGKTN